MALGLDKYRHQSFFTLLETLFRSAGAKHRRSIYYRDKSLSTSAYVPHILQCIH